MTAAPPTVLTVAGSDPSGGAGLQADLKTIHQHGAYGAAVPTLITVQDSLEVARVELLPADLVRAQLAAVLSDLEPAAAKAGALGSPEAARVLGSIMEKTRFGWVVDPVWLPSRGAPLSTGDMIAAYKDAIIPHAELVTPNGHEAALLAEMPVRTLDDARAAAERIAALGAAAVLIKGGHLQGADRGTDLLLHDGEREGAEGRRHRPRPFSWNGLHALCSYRVSTRVRGRPRGCGRGGQGLACRGARPCFRGGEGREARESSLASRRKTLALFEVLQTQ